MKEFTLIGAFFIILLIFLFFYFAYKFWSVKQVQESFKSQTMNRENIFQNQWLEEPGEKTRTPMKFRKYEYDQFQEASRNPVKQWDAVQYPNLNGSYDPLTFNDFGVSVGFRFDNGPPTTMSPVFSIENPEDNKMYCILFVLPKENPLVSGSRVAVFFSYKTPPGASPTFRSENNVVNMNSGMLYVSDIDLETHGDSNYLNIKFTRSWNRLAFYKKNGNEYDKICQVNIKTLRDKYGFDIYNQVVGYKTNVYAGFSNMPESQFAGASLKIHNLHMYKPRYKKVFQKYDQESGNDEDNYVDEGELEGFETYGGNKVSLLFPNSTDPGDWPWGRLIHFKDKTAKWISYMNQINTPGNSQASLYTTYNNTTGGIINAKLNIIADDECFVKVEGENEYLREYNDMIFKQENIDLYNEPDYKAIDGKRISGGWGHESGGYVYDIEIPPGKNTFYFKLKNHGVYNNPAGLLASVYTEKPDSQINWKQGYIITYYKIMDTRIADQKFMESFTTSMSRSNINTRNPQMIENTPLFFSDRGQPGSKPFDFPSKDYIYATITGYLFLEPGNYKFVVMSDDGVKLRMNNKNITLRRHDGGTDSWRPQAPTKYITEEIQISNSMYVPFTIQWYEWAGGAYIQLENYILDGVEKRIPLDTFQIPSTFGGEVDVLFNTNDQTWFYKNYVKHPSVPSKEEKTIDVRVHFETPDEKWSGSGQVYQVFFTKNGAQVSDRAYPKGINFARATTKYFDFTTTMIEPYQANGIYIYVQNDGIRIKQLKIEVKQPNGSYKEIYNEPFSVTWLKNKAQTFSLKKTITF